MDAPENDEENIEWSKNLINRLKSSDDSNYHYIIPFILIEINNKLDNIFYLNKI